MTRIPIVICIDVEPDGRSISREIKCDWKGFEETYDFLRRLRPRLEAATGSPVRFSWFLRMDPQIALVYGSPSWVTTHYRQPIDEVATMGDEIGLHPHPFRWHSSLNSWVADFGDQQWVNHCLEMAFSAFRESLGRPCLSFRFGDRWMNNATLARLEYLGARFDLTLEPSCKGSDELSEPFTGEFPDCRQIPQHPYHPSKAEFRQAGVNDPRELWVIPVSAGSIHSPRLISERLLTGKSWNITRGDQVITGTIVANPNPIEVNDLAEPGKTVLSWSCRGTEEVEVRVNAPDGPLFSKTASTGESATGRWVYDRTTFFLQDVSMSRTLTPDNTLATVSVRVTAREGSERIVGIPREDYLTLNLAFNSMVTSRIAENLIRTLQRPYLAFVVRTDAITRAVEGRNLKETFDYLLSHPRVKEFAFETPEELVARGE